MSASPEERFPFYVGGQQANAVKDRIQEFNAVLDVRVKNFADAHPDMNVILFDVYSWFNEKLDNASQYGFQNITG